MSESFNMKIIIMSATLPKMDELIDNKKEIPTLIENRNYYFDYFKQRVVCNYSMLKDKNEKNTSEEVFDKINDVIQSGKTRIIIECLTVNKVEEFYEELKKYKQQGFKVYKITGNTNNETRNDAITKIQEKNNKKYTNDKIILIGNQAIEAGIDIDMQVGFKDISMLDADEQFIGRIERNFNNTGKVYFFHMDNRNFIYKGDYRISLSLLDKKWREIFDKKEFNLYYKTIYKNLLNNEKENYKNFCDSLKNLKFKSIADTMQLINNKTYSFIFLTQYKGCKSAIELIDEWDILEKQNLGYAETMIKKRKIKKEMDKYIYNINAYKIDEKDILLNKKMGMYLVEDCENYFDNVENNMLLKDSALETNRFINSLGMFI